MGARRAGGDEELVVVTEQDVTAARRAGRAGDGARTFRALVRRARVYVVAPRREDFGIAQLEALADGCRARHHRAARARTSPATSRASSTRASSATTWRTAMRAALDDPAPGYAERARALVAGQFSPATVDAKVAELLARLL